MVLTPVRRSKRNQTGNTNTVDTAKIGDTVELTEVCSKTGETVMDGVIVIIDWLYTNSLLSNHTHSKNWSPKKTTHFVQ